MYLFFAKKRKISIITGVLVDDFPYNFYAWLGCQMKCGKSKVFIIKELPSIFKNIHICIIH